jgi:hypothetical protein
MLFVVSFLNPLTIQVQHSSSQPSDRKHEIALFSEVIQPFAYDAPKPTPVVHSNPLVAATKWVTAAVATKKQMADAEHVKNATIASFAGECCQNLGLHLLGYEPMDRRLRSNKSRIYEITASDDDRGIHYFAVKVGLYCEFLSSKILVDKLKGKNPPACLAFANPMYAQWVDIVNTGIPVDGQPEINQMCARQSDVLDLSSDLPPEFGGHQLRPDRQDSHFCLLFMPRALGESGTNFFGKLWRFPMSYEPVSDEQVKAVYRNLAKTVNFLHKFFVCDISRTNNVFVDIDTGTITVMDVSSLAFFDTKTELYHPLVANDKNEALPFNWYFSEICNDAIPLDLVQIFYDNLDDELKPYVSDAIEVGFQDDNTSDFEDRNVFRAGPDVSLFSTFCDCCLEIKVASHSDSTSDVEDRNFFGTGPDMSPESTFCGRCPDSTDPRDKKGGSSRYTYTNSEQKRLTSDWQELVSTGAESIQRDLDVRRDMLARVQRDVQETKQYKTPFYEHMNVFPHANIHELSYSTACQRCREMWGIEYSTIIPDRDKELLRMAFLYSIPTSLMMILLDPEREQAVRHVLPSFDELFTVFAPLTQQDIRDCSNAHDRYVRSLIVRLPHKYSTYVRSQDHPNDVLVTFPRKDIRTIVVESLVQRFLDVI